MNRPNTSERRQFLKAGLGLGSWALAELIQGSKILADEGVPLKSHGTLRELHHPPRAKRMISIHMLGAVSQVDTFDYKPMLEKMHGQQIPDSVKGKARISAMSGLQGSFPLVKPLAPFKQYGQSGAWVSDLMPYTAKIGDDLCFVKSFSTEHVNHDPASKFLHTGFQLAGRPAEGAWVNYALGSENGNLPAFIVLTSQGTPAGQSHDASAWSAGFLPSLYQGVPFRAGRDPVLYVNDPEGVDLQERRVTLDAIGALAKIQQRMSGDEEIASKISQYEMAYRMQASIPEVADISQEPESILNMYGPDVRRPGTFARNCLLARRLAERDVRFISLFQSGWDHHNGLARNHPIDCQAVDQPSAALITDLKQRGLLKDTLVVWGSEFGRTCFAQGNFDGNWGRDHHGGNFTYWLAGGGVKAGFTYGETDDFSYNIVKHPLNLHDLHATMLHLFGIDHERLTFRSQGRDFRLTDVQGEVIREVLA